MDAALGGGPSLPRIVTKKEEPTMTITIEIPTEFLKAALVSVSTERARYYLCGVLLDATGWVVSTDGARMFAGQCPALHDLPQDMIVPTAAIKAALTKSRSNTAILQELGEGRWTIDAGSGPQMFAPIDGTFPPWRRGVPSRVKEGPALYDPGYYADLGKMAQALGGQKTDFWINQDPSGPSPVMFGGRKDCFAVVMPMRGSPITFDASQWVPNLLAAQEPNPVRQS